MVTFTAARPVNVLSLNELNILSDFRHLDFSHAGFKGFTASAGEVDLRFTGDFFLYVPFTDRPFAGVVTSLTVQDHGITQYRFSDTSITIGHITDFTEPSTLFHGADTLNGSSGNDVLFGFAGRDTVNGRTGDDAVSGDAGNDTVNGGPGGDTMSGGSGNDRFLFNTQMNPLDTITDFATGRDVIQLDRRIFGGIGPHGPLDADVFVVGDHATTTTQRIVYDPNGSANAGLLYYDSNGSDPGGMTLFATLNGHPTLSAANFFVI